MTKKSSVEDLVAMIRSKPESEQDIIMKVLWKGLGYDVEARSAALKKMREKQARREVLYVELKAGPTRPRLDEVHAELDALHVEISALISEVYGAEKP